MDINGGQLMNRIVGGGGDDVRVKGYGDSKKYRGELFQRFPAAVGQRGDQPLTLSLPSAAPSALYTTLFSRDLIMADSLAMMTEPICV